MHDEIREALKTLPENCLKPWRQLDGLPYLHATDDADAKPYNSPVVGRFDYLETMRYISACNPVAIVALLEDRDRLAADADRYREIGSVGMFWLQNREDILAAIEKAGFRLMSNQHGFWLAALAPASPHKESQK